MDANRSGYDKTLKFLGIPSAQKEFLPVKSYEVQKIVKKIRDQERPEFYSPFERNRKTITITKEAKLRNRGFRQAIIEAYDFKCAVCGLKINTPNTMQWEVEAAHIVPHNSFGKDDVWNGLALCHLHHWAFDVGWFSFEDNFRVITSSKIRTLSPDYGKMWDYDFIGQLSRRGSIISLPDNRNNHPHLSAVIWHRENIFLKQSQ